MLLMVLSKVSGLINGYTYMYFGNKPKKERLQEIEMEVEWGAQTSRGNLECKSPLFALNGACWTTPVKTSGPPGEVGKSCSAEGLLERPAQPASAMTWSLDKRNTMHEWMGNGWIFINYYNHFLMMKYLQPGECNLACWHAKQVMDTPVIKVAFCHVDKASWSMN